MVHNGVQAFTPMITMFLLLPLLASCQDGTPANDTASGPAHETNAGADVWGAQGLNLCPEASWQALSPGSIQVEYSATAIKMHGPRFFLMDAISEASLPEADVRTYWFLPMARPRWCRTNWKTPTNWDEQSGDHGTIGPA